MPHNEEIDQLEKKYATVERQEILIDLVNEENQRKPALWLLIGIIAALVLAGIGILSYYNTSEATHTRVFEFTQTLFTKELLFYILVGLAAQTVDGALGMAYGATSSSLLLGLGIPPSIASASVHVAEVFTIGKESAGAWRIEQVDAVVDCGRVINLSGAKAQLEGAIMDGITVALYGGVQIAEGRVVTGNFDRYRLGRIQDAPRAINISFIDNDERSMGLGEVGLPPAIPAFCNAYSKAFNTRVRKLPLRS